MYDHDESEEVCSFPVVDKTKGEANPTLLTRFRVLIYRYIYFIYSLHMTIILKNESLDGDDIMLMTTELRNVTDILDLSV